MKAVEKILKFDILMDLLLLAHPREIIQRLLRKWNRLMQLKSSNIIIPKSNANVVFGGVKIYRGDPFFRLELPDPDWVKNVVNSLFFILF